VPKVHPALAIRNSVCLLINVCQEVDFVDPSTIAFRASPKFAILDADVHLPIFVQKTLRFSRTDEIRALWRDTMSVSLCKSCMETFNSVGAFDKHRVGGYGEPIYEKGQLKGYTKHTRRCMTVAEMVAAGMVKNKYGYWITEAMPEEQRLLREQRKANQDQDEPEEEATA
jgi:hypothetical protein